VGKTFLVKEYFNQKFAFHITGLANADTQQQLFNFDTEISSSLPFFLNRLQKTG
jgi:hypothetical protein